MAIEADTLYVAPPGRHLDVAGGRFTVREVVHCDRLRMPIDHFLCTLAAQQAYRCCGVLLSGGGSDGMLGLSEIKACGGLTIAQDPAEAQTPEMPQHALTADVVDLALKVAEMPAAILAYAEKVASEDLPEDDEAALRGILALLRTRSGHDFRCYKRGTLVRRIRRRAELTKSPGLAGLPPTTPDARRGDRAASQRPPDRRHGFLPPAGGVAGARGEGHWATDFRRRGRQKAVPARSRSDFVEGGATPASPRGSSTGRDRGQ